MSLRARLLNGWLRRVERPAMTRATSHEVLRRRFEVQAKLFFRAPRGTQMQWQDLQHGQRQVRALEVVPRSLESDVALLYIHGGGFVFGSPRGYAPLAAQIAHRLGARAVLPRYRRAPEDAFPGAFDDVCTAWHALRATGVPAGRIAVGGDSAGGALAFSLMGQLISEGAALPAAVFGFSPLLDLTYSGESFITNAAQEAMLPVERAHETMAHYVGRHDPKDPRISPLWADVVGAPPVWLCAGDTEILRDDARRMAARLKEAGAHVTYREENDLPHVWPIFHNILPEAHETLDDLSHWLRQRLAGQGES